MLVGLFTRQGGWLPQFKIGGGITPLMIGLCSKCYTSNIELFDIDVGLHQCKKCITGNE